MGKGKMSGDDSANSKLHLDNKVRGSGGTTKKRLDPGSTDRLLTVAQLRSQRNLELPNWLLRYSELRGRYIQFGKASEQYAKVRALWKDADAELTPTLTDLRTRYARLRAATAP